MDNREKVIIYILSGAGKIPEGWQESFDGEKICGFPVEIRMVGKGQMEAGPPIGISLLAPFSILGRLGGDEAGKFKDAVAEFVKINNGSCNFGIQLKSDYEGVELEINIASKNLHLRNIDNFFHSLEEKVGEFITNIKPPYVSRWALYANIDSDEEVVRGITGLDLNNRDFYIYEMTSGEWIKQEVPENTPT